MTVGHASLAIAAGNAWMATAPAQGRAFRIARQEQIEEMIRTPCRPGCHGRRTQDIMHLRQSFLPASRTLGENSEMSITTPVKARRWSPTPEQAEYIRVTEATNRFLHNLPDDVRRHFAGQWVAANDSGIVATAPTYAELHAKLANRNDPTILVLKLQKGVTIPWRSAL